jgi:hypothetical protein
MATNKPKKQLRLKPKPKPTLVVFKTADAAKAAATGSRPRTISSTPKPTVKPKVTKPTIKPKVTKPTTYGITDSQNTARLKAKANSDAATQAVVKSGGLSTDRKNRLKGETATQANIRITAAYKAQPKPKLTAEGEAAGATIRWVRTGAGGVGKYKEIWPIGTAIPKSRTSPSGNTYDKNGNLIPKK